MKPEFNESWLTAYVLGELNEEEKSVVEEELQKSEWVRRQVDEIRATADLVSRELTNEPAPRLYEYQRKSIEDTLHLDKKATVSILKLSVAGTLAAAASLLLVFLLPLSDSHSPKPVRQIENRSAAAPSPGLAVQSEPDDSKPDNPEPSAHPVDTVTVQASSEPTTAVSQIGDLPKVVEPALKERVGSDLFSQSHAVRPPQAGDKKAAPSASTGAIFGRVFDSTGAVLPGAEITTRDALSGQARRVATDAAGNFRLNQMPAGQHEINVSLPGFKSFSSRVLVSEAGEIQLNALLQVGEIAETVAVEAFAPTIQASTAQIASGKATKARDNLSTLALARRMPAAVPPRMDIPPGARGDRPQFNTEAYDRIEDNRFIRVLQDPLSTFSIDVDTASYSNVRRFLEQASFPPKDSVRIEEMINYFAYDYPQPKGEHPFAVHLEVAQAPWRHEHRLVRVGIKGREIDLSKRPPSNLVFLIDVSGSMEPANKLPLLKQSMRLLVEKLTENDRVAMVVYAGASGLVLPSTSCDDKEKVLAALDQLDAGGSTNGGAGIQLAYQTAVANFIPGGTNRVILATDGDFNIGITNQGDLTRLIEKHAKSGVFLTVLGFGMGNYKDSMLEKLADRGNGNYAYIDTLNEGRKVLVEQMGGSLITIAKDVKIQVEFNPGEVNAYRLIGYENRILRHEDFNDDTKDAGEIGAGHTVTALYEVVPTGVEINVPGVDPLKYQKPIAPAKAANKGELLTIKLRYKKPDGEKSQLIELPVTDPGKAFEQASEDLRFAAAVASFGMLLRDSPYKGNSTFEKALTIAESSLGDDPNGYRKEFVRLVKRARAIQELKSEKPEA